MSTHGKSNGKGPGVGGFQHLGLSQPIFRAIMAMGYKVPTPIQRKSLPVVLSGKDVVAMARTGSGKTAAFLIPMLEKLKEHSKKIGVRALVLAPTRELAVQTLKFAKSLAKFTSLKISLIVGGEGMEQQFEMIASNPDVLVATPGRLMHHLQEIPDFHLKSIEYVVFDEADRIFEMGFADQLTEIMKTMPTSRQTLLFSATLPKALVQFARAGLNEPELIRLDVENKISENLKLAFFTVRAIDKPAIFLYLVRDFLNSNEQTIVFAATRHHVEFLHELLKAFGIESSCVYGEMDQASRKINIGKFRAKKTNLLIVTDVAARGIDIPLLNNVLNYSFPPTAKLFVHRVGRAARAGNSGTAFSLVDSDEQPFMVDLYLYLGRSLDESHPKDDISYTLDTMTTQDVHYGTLPNELIDVENEHIRETVSHHPAVAPLVKVCANAFKLYARTRSDASKNSIHRAKDELSPTKLHPLFKENSFVNQAKMEYVTKLQNFRPPQTIFEITNGVNTQALNQSAPSVQMMRKKRKIHQRIIANKNKKSRGEGEDQLAERAEVDAEAEDDHDPNKVFATQKQSENLQDQDEHEEDQDASSKSTVKLSKYERKQLKKRVANGENAMKVMQELQAHKDQQHAQDQAQQLAKQAEHDALYEKDAHMDSNNTPRFKDDDNYIGYIKQSDAIAEEFLSKAADGGKTNAFEQARLEEAILDVNPDEAIELNKKRRVLHWDTRKKKFVKTTVGQISSSGKRRNESGVKLDGTKRKKEKVGDMYKKWQQKQHKRVFTGGEEQDPQGDPSDRKLDYRFGRKPVGMPPPNKMRVNRHVKNELLEENKIRKEEARKARSRGIKPHKTNHTNSKRGKGNIRGKTHGAPTRSKSIVRR